MRQLLPKKVFYFIVSALFLLSVSGCEKKNNTIVDTAGIAPVLSEASFSLSVVNTDTMNVGGEHRPGDVLTISGIASLRIGMAADGQLGSIDFSVLSAATGDVLDTGVLSNIHISHDNLSNDSVYTGTATFQMTRDQIGAFYLNFWVESNTGYQSTSHYISFSVIRLNRPPVISNLQMDTLVSTGGIDQRLAVKIKATDQDGQSDISKVYFNSYKPNGAPSTGNPFFMYDDGTNGDSMAGDSIYTLSIALPGNTALGVYRFEFQAVDRTNNISNTIIQKITITY